MWHTSWWRSSHDSSRAAIASEDVSSIDCLAQRSGTGWCLSRGETDASRCFEFRRSDEWLLVEETAVGKHCGEIRGSASGGSPGQPTERRADRSPAAERPESDGRARI